MVDVESLKVEYKELCENMRHYADMRFKLLTLFSVFTGFLLTVSFSSQFTFNSKTVLNIGGLIITAAFWIMEERYSDYWHAFRKRAEKIEEILDLRQYHDRPTKTFLAKLRLTATNATRFLYSTLLIFWVFRLLKCL